MTNNNSFSSSRIEKEIKSFFPAKPFVKWAGGKSQLLSKFKDLYPQKLKNHKIQTYYEPFVGSGAVFFDIAQHYSIQNAYLYDINKDLILTYNVIQRDTEDLLEILNKHEKTYSNLDEESRKKYYYKLRSNYNEERFYIDYQMYSDDWFSRAAQLIFLNKTCFNGLYRVNSKGEFNSPVGNYKNPRICDEKNLMSAQRVLLKANIKTGDFKEVMHDIKDNSFVYLDPPYKALSSTANFKSYSKNGFSDLEQIRLGQLFRKLDQKQVRLMLSNSDPKNTNPNDNFFDEMYKGFNIMRIPAKRLINSNATKRGSINEIVITNYKTG